MDYKIALMEDNDWEQVRSIYLEGIATNNATFETVAPSLEEWKSRHIPECSIVARMDKTIWGWAALSPVSHRRVYQGVGEVSIYVGENYRGFGLGSVLLSNLIEISEKSGFWTLQAAIFPENHASITIHKKQGFREIGIRERLGKLNGVWRDIILLERRSEIGGVE